MKLHSRTNENSEWLLRVVVRPSHRTGPVLAAADTKVSLRQCSFYECKSLASMTFDADSKVSRFDRRGFSKRGLTLIHIYSSIKVICERCFFTCQPLASMTFDAGDFECGQAHCGKRGMKKIAKAESRECRDEREEKLRIRLSKDGLNC
jgi:hypothetical protein